MALDLTLSTRVRASVSSDADSGFYGSSDPININIRPDEDDLQRARSANVSPIPQHFSLSSVRSAPVSPNTQACDGSSSSSSSRHMSPGAFTPPLRPASRPVSRLRDTSPICVVSTSEPEDMDTSDCNTDTTHGSSSRHDGSLSPQKMLQKQRMSTAPSQPPKLISDKTHKNSDKFNMDSLLAEPSDKPRKRSNLVVPPPLDLYSSNRLIPAPNLSPYDYRSRHAHQSPHPSPHSAHTSQRFNFDLMNLRADLPVHSPVLLSPYDADSANKIFNFVSPASLPCSPRLPITHPHVPSSPLLPLSPLITASHRWPLIAPPRLDSSSHEEHEQSMKRLPYQTYASPAVAVSTAASTLRVHPSKVSPEHARSQALRSPKLMDSGTTRRHSPNHVVFHHPYSQVARDAAQMRNETEDKAQKVATIRRRIFSNVDLKCSLVDRNHDRHPTSRSVSSKASPQCTYRQPNLTLQPGFLSKIDDKFQRMARSQETLSVHVSPPPVIVSPTSSGDNSGVNASLLEEIRAKRAAEKGVTSHKEQHAIANGSISGATGTLANGSRAGAGGAEEHGHHRRSSTGSDQSCSSDNDSSSAINVDDTEADDVFDSLPFDPRHWSRVHVSEWLTYICTNHGIEFDTSRFKMNGKALCLMTQEMFLSRVPSGGSVLFADFQNRLNKVLAQNNIAYPLKKRKTLSV